MDQFKDEIDTERLQIWLSSADQFEDAHVDSFLAAREWEHRVRLGPIRVLPNIVERSVVIYERALNLLGSHPSRTVDLVIELRDGRKPLSWLPSSVGSINRILSVTPPWLWIRDGNGYPELPPGVDLSIQRLDTAKLFARWMSQANLERVKADLKEYKSPQRLARYITLSLKASPDD